MAERIVVVSIPQLRHRDVTPGALASVEALAARGGLVELIPPFPALAAPSFATLMTGTGPYEHGLIGNAYFDREQKRVVAAPLPDSAVRAPKIWERLKAAQPGAKTMLWFAPNSEGAAVEIDAGVDLSWTLSTQPEGLAAELVGRFGPFPRPGDPSASPPPGKGKGDFGSGFFPRLDVRPAGQRPRLAATSWILKTAAAVIASEQPDLAVVRVPYLGQIARRFGPDGREANRAVRELEAELGPFLASLPRETLVLAVTESVITPVAQPSYPNRILLGLGMLALHQAPGGGLDVDLDRSAAFGLADHQLCHIYLNDRRQEAPVASAFAGSHSAGVATVASGPQRASLGLDHPLAGDVILVACPESWFAPDWWTSPGDAPRGPEGTSGLAHATTTGLIDPANIKGSLGAPPPNAEYHGLLVASHADGLGDRHRISAREVAALVLRNWGIT
jgi:predicted AlkP superfamily pyrophosphatase or phosphodiesterase